MDMNQSNMAFKASSSASRQVQNPVNPQNQQSTHELNDPLSQKNLQQRQARVQQLTGQHLSLFWFERLLEIQRMDDHKQYMLPLARIKREMKSDDKVEMISADAPMLFSKAAELFIMELTLRSWMHTETCSRRILQRADIANAISDTQVFDFLLNTVPREGGEEDEAPEGQAMPPHNVNYFPMLRAHVQQQLNAAEQMTDGNAGRNTPVLINELNYPVLAPNSLSMSPSPNQFSLRPLPSPLPLTPTRMVNKELMLGNMGGESSCRSPGTCFPFLDADGYHFNFNPVTDDKMADHPGVEMHNEHPKDLGMLGLNSFIDNFNLPQNYNPAEQMTEGIAGQNTPVLANESNYPVLAPNSLFISPSPNQFSPDPSPNQYSLPPLPSQFSLSPTPMVNEELMLGNMGACRFRGTYFPFVDADRYHFNYNPVTDHEMGDHPGVEMHHEHPNEAFLGMLGLNSFNNDFNFPQNYNP